MNGYNGWTNYATRNIMLWIDNDEPMYRAKLRQLRSVEPSEIDASFAEDCCRHCLGGESTPDLEDSDGCRWSDVNWTEIAEHLKDELSDM